MPDVWTHLISGDKTVELLTPLLADFLTRHKKVFYFGCQGPDLFYYYNFRPWTIDRRGQELAHVIHYERCGEFFVRCFDHVASLPTGQNREHTEAYAYGLLCHYAVDRVTHPYLHYITGVYLESDRATWPLRHNHKRVEAAIDSILALEHYNIDVVRTPLNHLFDLGPEPPRFLVNLYEQVIPNLYPEAWAKQSPGVVEKAYRDMRGGALFGFDPWGYKRAFFILVDVLTRYRYNFRYFYSRPADKLKGDYFNLSNREWVDPVDENERSSSSLYELLAMAHLEAAEMINSTNLYLAKELDRSDWISGLGNLSFSTGRDSSEQVRLKHFKPILD